MKRPLFRWTASSESPRQRPYRRAVQLLILGVALVTIWRLLVPAPFAPPKTEIWEAVKRESRAANLDPAFVWAIAHAESSLDVYARNGRAVGLMQITPIAWRQVRDTPFAEARDWEANLAAAIDYLRYCRTYLKRKKHFSYPLLAACYRHGPGRVREAGFRIGNLPPPRNRIYRKLFAGERQPVPLPTGE